MLPKKTLQERLTAFVRVDPDGCWKFNGAILRNGYGLISDGNGNEIMAHRAAWTMFRGPIPDGLLVCHTCDHRYCINPDHLFLGTQKDNMRDMRSKHEGTSQRGQNNRNAKLTPEQVNSIRQRKGERQRALASEFGCSSANICNILHGKTWK